MYSNRDRDLPESSIYSHFIIYIITDLHDLFSFPSVFLSKERNRALKSAEITCTVNRRPHHLLWWPWRFVNAKYCGKNAYRQTIRGQIWPNIERDTCHRGVSFARSLRLYNGTTRNFSLAASVWDDPSLASGEIRTWPWWLTDVEREKYYLGTLLRSRVSLLASNI